MLTFNTMRFGTDVFSTDKQALLVTKKALDTNGQTAVEGFTITGTQPTGTNRRFLFKVDDKVYKFSGQNVVEYTGAIDAAGVLASGNTASEVTAVTNIPAWVGKKIYPIIALEAASGAVAMPTAKMSLKVRSATDVYENVTESAEYELAAAGGATPRIVEVSAKTTCTGQGSVKVEVRIRNRNEQSASNEGENNTGGDVWSEYMPLTAAKDRDADAVQFRMTYRVTTLSGADTAKVNSIVVKSTMGAAAVSGDTAELYSIITDYEHTLGTCAVSIRHDRLIDSKIGAYVNFMQPPKKRKLLPIGVATGASQQLMLGVDGVKDTGINQATLKIFADGKAITGFSYNTEVSEVTVTATVGAAITASYEYGHQQEVWREMAIDVNQQPYNDGTYLTRFTYTLPDDEVDGQTVSNVRIQLYRPSGTVEAESLGVASGLVQQFVLSHAAKAETVQCNADFSYDADSQIITCVAPKDTEIVAKYDWVGENPTIRQWSAGWAPNV